MSYLPRWARIPNVKYGEVIATNAGWVLRQKGKRDQLLSSIKGLDKMLKDLMGEVSESNEAIQIKKKAGRPVGSSKQKEIIAELDKPKKKAGRPFGSKSKNKSIMSKVKDMVMDL